MVEVEEDLAVKLKHSDLGVLDAFGSAVRDADLVGAPQVRELCALGEQSIHDRAGFRLFSKPRVGGA